MLAHLMCTAWNSFKLLLLVGVIIKLVKCLSSYCWFSVLQNLKSSYPVAHRRHFISGKVEDFRFNLFQYFQCLHFISIFAFLYFLLSFIFCFTALFSATVNQVGIHRQGCGFHLNTGF